MSEAKIKSQASTRAQNVAFCGITIALMIVSAWVTFPIGPVPITLQVFVVIFAVLFLTPKQCMASIGIYVLLGAIGLPVFSGMRGGLGVIAGPTGGFLWGFILAGALALLVSKMLFQAKDEKEMPRGRVFIARLLVGSTFLAGLYVCGWTQLVFVTGMTPEAAFLAGVAPFIVVDIVKMLAAVSMVDSMKRAGL